MKPIPQEPVDIISALRRTVGGISREGIKALECFHVEQRVRELLSITAFHDDRHATVIVVAAGRLNALHLTRRDVATLKVICTIAAAAVIACLDMLVALGMRRKNLTVCDIHGA